MEWRKEGNTYILRDGQDDILRCEGKVAIAYSYDENEERGIRGTLHKYGSPELVTRWYNSAVRIYRSAGGLAAKMADELWLVEGEFDVEDLNRFISTTGSVEKFHEEIRGKLIKDDTKNFNFCSL